MFCCMNEPEITGRQSWQYATLRSARVHQLRCRWSFRRSQIQSFVGSDAPTPPQAQVTKLMLKERLAPCQSICHPAFLQVHSLALNALWEDLMPRYDRGGTNGRADYVDRGRTSDAGQLLQDTAGEGKR